MSLIAAHCWPGAPARLPIFWFNAKWCHDVFLALSLMSFLALSLMSFMPSYLAPDVFFGSKSDAICHLNFSERNTPDRHGWASWSWGGTRCLGSRTPLSRLVRCCTLGSRSSRQQVYRSALTLALICRTFHHQAVAGCQKGEGKASRTSRITSIIYHHKWNTAAALLLCISPLTDLQCAVTSCRVPVIETVQLFGIHDFRQSYDARNAEGTIWWSHPHECWRLALFFFLSLHDAFSAAPIRCIILGLVF